MDQNFDSVKYSKQKQSLCFHVRMLVSQSFICYSTKAVFEFCQVRGARIQWSLENIFMFRSTSKYVLKI